MTVLRESPWYNEIVKEGLLKGRQEGRQEGLQEEAANLVIRLLTRRLGELPASQVERVRGLSVSQLEDLGEALLDFTSLSQVEDWLVSNS